MSSLKFNNVCNGDIFPYPLAFISGRVDSTAAPSPHQIRVTSINTSSYWPVVSGQFKCLIGLRPGAQRIDFQYDGCSFKQELELIYEPITLRNKFIRVLYVIPHGDEGRFQSPDDGLNTTEHAIAKIELGVQLLQTLTGERMKEQGFGRRTFDFAKTDGKVCHVFRSKWNREAFWSRSGEELWEGVAKELLIEGYINENEKVLAFLSCTTYQKPDQAPNASGSLEQRYLSILGNTKAYAAYGAGGLALIGTPCLYTWADNLDQLTFSLTNPALVEPEFMDDSAFRGTWGGCYATTLGASLHELGHTLDLGHVDYGIMARGCDDLDRFFSFPTQTATSLNLCSRKKTSRPLHVSIHIQPVTKRVIKPPTRNEAPHLSLAASSHKEAGNAYWHRSNVVLLAYHPWLNPPTDCASPSDSIVYDNGQITAPSGLRLVELRTKDNDYLQHWEFISDPPRCYILPLSSMASLQRIHHCILVLAMDSYGNTMREWTTRG